KEEKEMYSYFGLEENEFSSKLDSLIKVRNNLFADFKDNESELTSGFVNIANAAITYPIYRLKEIYPYYYKKAHKLDEFPKLSNTFYNYRKEVDINNTSLMPLYSYQNYIVSYLYNQTFQKVQDNNEDDDFVLHLMDITNDKVKIEDLKNTILQKIVIDDFLHSSSTCTINKKVYDKFKDFCSNTEVIEHVNNLVEDTQFIKQDFALPNFEVVNSNGRRFEIKDLIKNQNTVLYFWNINYMSSEYLYKRINYLEKKLPNIQFIGINISDDYNVTNEPYLKKLNISNQYTLPTNSMAHQFLTSNYPRTILINSKGIVTNGFILLNSKKLWGELIKLEKN
ncbi:MAG TPA: hypothetical protein VJ970_01710, partial [Flavobacteriaceae bacterium]|nr:hypothetical protein [Flavobacteriaceae bacterium]